jgi:hypothetical protein
MLLQKARRARLIAEAGDMMNAFDDALNKLRSEKFSVEASIKGAEVQRVVMWKEYLLLCNFSSRDQALAKKADDKIAERQELVGKMQKGQQQLLDLKQHLENVIKRKKEIASRLDKLVPEGHAHRAVLLTMFNRKVKRRKRVSGPDDDSSSDDDDGDDEDSDEDGQAEACPVGCSQSTYDEVGLARPAHCLSACNDPVA